MKTDVNKIVTLSNIRLGFRETSLIAPFPLIVTP